MKNIYNIILSLAVLVLAASCDLTESPKANADKSMVFGSESGLQVYTYSFYNYLPSRTSAFQLDAMADYGAKNSLSTYETGSYTTETSTSWDWSGIRNVNYFINNNTDENVSETVRNNYTGIARLFRAYLYFDKLVTYGEVPWLDKVLDQDSEELYAPRDTRDVIITNIINDLNFAFKNITTTSITANSNEVNNWCALLLKSRVCLFEASWRKYHAGTDYVENCTITADELFTMAANAADSLIKYGPYALSTSGTQYGNGRGPYRDLFVSDDAVTSEVMLSVAADKVLGMGEQNWWYNSSTYGPHLCMSRAFAKTYLNIDGTVYDEKNSDGTYKTFVEETTDRDQRLNQTIRGYDYTRKDSDGNYVYTSANFTGHSLTGYQFTKYVMDDVSYDDARTNDNDIPLMRYAEALLNYAEAKAELGTITDEDWANTIGALRKRAGITGGDLESLPTTVDSYLQETFYPDISNPVILEIRRERAIELCLEGFRMFDLKRWACGELWESLPWTGVYVPALDTPLDMNGDGTYDVYITTDADYSGDYKGIAMYISGAQGVEQLSDDPDNGYILTYTMAREWNDNMYLYPIPSQVILMNENLTQNPGW
jgi:hypothetical protein